MARVGVIGWPQETNELLAEGWSACAPALLRPGDVGYSPPGHDVYADAAEALELQPAGVAA